jgi:ribonuclease VapC
MIVDSSAILAILQEEPEADRFRLALTGDSYCAVSVANWLELGMLAFRRRGEDGVRDLDLLVAQHSLVIEGVTPAQGRLARRAFMKYGKGVHPARLNFGDCFAYALAKDTGEPLLFKGEDFTQTDVAAAAY